MSGATATTLGATAINAVATKRTDDCSTGTTKGNAIQLRLPLQLVLKVANPSLALRRNAR